MRRVENCPPITPPERGAVPFDDGDLAQIAGFAVSLPGSRVLWVELGRMTVWIRSQDLALDDDPEAVRLRRWARDRGDGGLQITYSAEVGRGERRSFASLGAALAASRERVCGLALAEA